MRTKKCNVCKESFEPRTGLNILCGDYSCEKEWKAKKALRARKRTKRTKGRAWNTFSEYIRIRDCLKTTGTINRCKCVTCEKNTGFRNIQAGHFIPGRGNSVLFHEDIVHGQCKACNIFKRGNYTIFTIKMVQRFGLKRVEELQALRHQVKILKYPDYIGIIEKYKKKKEQLENN